MPSIDGRVVGIKLKEADLAALNLKLKEKGYSSLADMIRALLKNEFNPTDDLVEKLSELMAKWVAQKLTSGTLAKGETTNSRMNLEPRAGFDPATYCLQGN